MLPQRVAVSAVGIPVIIGLTHLGGPVFAIAVGAALTIAALEFYAATDPTSQGEQRPLWEQRIPALIGAAGVALLVAAADNGFEWWRRALTPTVALPFPPLLLRGPPPTGPP